MTEQKRTNMEPSTTTVAKDEQPNDAGDLMANLAGAVWHPLRRTGLYIPLLFLTLMVWRAPYADPRDWDYDEGINLMKVLLLDRGYALYGEIWSDQPPLLTVMLSGWFKLFDASAASGRVLILLFSALLLWALFLTMRNFISEWAATLAILLLVLSEYYIRLSGAVMVGLPALSLATCAVAVLATGERQWWRLAFSALLFALALQVKLFVAVMGPTFCCFILFQNHAGGRELRWSERLIQVVIWSGTLAAVYGSFGLVLGSLRPDMLLGTHFGAQTQNQSIFVREASAFLPNFYLLHTPYLIVAAIGVIWAVRQRDRSLIFPLTWFLTTWLALNFQRPLWYHHVLLLTIPLAWLCAYGIEIWVRGFRRLSDEFISQRSLAVTGIWLTLSATLLIAWIALLPSPLADRLAEQQNIYRPNYIAPAFELLREDADQQPGWVFTDRPFYAFEAGLPVPPPIAVLSRKTMETGVITEQDLLDVLDGYKPRYVLLERFHYEEAFMERLAARYDLVFDSVEPARYYRIKPEYADDSTFPAKMSTQ